MLNAARKDGVLNGAVLAVTTDNYSDVDFQSVKYDYPTVATLLSPTDALMRVMGSAGASRSRDHVDAYLINTELASMGTVGALITDPTLPPINGPGPVTGGTVSEPRLGRLPLGSSFAHRLRLTPTEMVFRIRTRTLMV